MSKRDIDRRLDELARRAKSRHRGIVPTIDTLLWPDDDRLAYARAARDGDEAACDALIERLYGKLPEAEGDEIVAIIVCEHAGNGPDPVEREE